MTAAQFGMIGLGTMGRNFLLNIADSGIGCAGYDLDPAKQELLKSEGHQWNVAAATSVEELVRMLKSPRAVMMLVPAGPIVDSVIEELLPYLGNGDLIIDGGNSHFSDTDRRERYLAEKGIGFLGVGVSGGEEGARMGASIMPGGRREYYDRVAPIFEAVAAKVDGEPCLAYMGSGSAGHFVKMVHNGIEYAMMQILAEAYDMMRRVLRMSHASMGRTFAEWNTGELGGYLVEITSTVCRKIDPETGQPLLEKILDTAGQKGTGVWTSQAALEMGIPIPTIDAAVSMRQISSQKHLRRSVAELYELGSAASVKREERGEFLLALRSAVYGSFIASYAQGMDLLRAASAERGYGLDLAEIARIWRGGCIIRSRFLEKIYAAYSGSPGLPHLLLYPEIAADIENVLEDWRYAVSLFAENPLPGMAIASALFYTEALASERLPANLTQAQRDYFGAHTYQRIDKEGTFHTDDW
ncbi:MAG TPA: NADP-dependent phosphogluconate dehydrogenase [Pyrinomonadaceae bacterium]|nr:NADP-dependent phosphogluconate dehydrogenase [Pyrinomonadaceae bacterium]HMP65700.1 NADP-dependent phosphogluconate dehydrogenase [Pyrinomonadaceae bacterium]